MSDRVSNNGHKGHCRCNGVKMEASSAPHFASLCHCEDYRRSNAAPIVAFVGFKRTDIRWHETASLGKYVNGTVTRLFCNRCGSPVGHDDTRLIDDLYFYTGFMDQPEDYPPTWHGYTQHRLAWLSLNDGLPGVEGTTVTRNNVE